MLPFFNDSARVDSFSSIERSGSRFNFVPLGNGSRFWSSPGPEVPAYDDGELWFWCDVLRINSCCCSVWILRYWPCEAYYNCSSCTLYLLACPRSCTDYVRSGSSCSGSAYGVRDEYFWCTLTERSRGLPLPATPGSETSWLFFLMLSKAKPPDLLKLDVV